MTNRMLLTALGLGPKETIYSLEGRTYRSTLSPVALYNLLPEDERFEKVLALCTDEVLEKTFPLLEQELPVTCEPVCVPIGASADDLQTTVHNILEKIPEKTKLTLDVTHGFRHYPFLFFTACLYLIALKDVKINKIWYGRLDAKNPDGATPFIDLSILLEMVDWFRVVQSFRDMSKPKALADKLLAYKDVIKRDKNIPKSTKKKYNAVTSAADKFAELFGMGLPVELGISSAKLQRLIEELRMEGDISAIKIPLAGDLLLEMKNAAERFRISDGEEKKDLILDIAEIHRQEGLIDAYFEAGYHNNAIGLIRELIISRLMLADGAENSWLDKSERRKVERCIGALMDYSKKSSSDLTNNRKELAGVWSSVIDARNKLHHHGMTKDIVSGGQIGIPDWWEKLKLHLDDNSFWDCDFGGGSGRLLISALGLHPGFLYTALINVNPNVCLVVASHETVGIWDELARKASYSGDFDIREMDAHSFDDAKTIVGNSEGLLVRFDEILSNLTGGTAAMQYAVIQLSRIADSLGRKVRWIAAIDNRSLEEQKLNPYVKGEVVCLEDAGI